MNCILVIRHAEKPDGTNSGVDETGTADDESLIVRGWQRAGALAIFFGATGGLNAPDRIYASASEKLKMPEGKAGSNSERPGQTVSPLASKIAKTVIDKFTNGQEADLVNEITGLPGTTLVCWQHEAIPAIAQAILGTATGIPDPWPSDRFDVVWRFGRDDSSQPWAFDQVCQNLLSGDQANLIT